MTEIINGAIDHYYKLKQSYEDKLRKQKFKILRNTNLSVKEKRLQWMQEKKKCIICKKNGGTIFKNKNNILSAICGSKNPCKLNININKGYYTNIRSDYLNLYQEIKSLHTEIIDVKLKLLFNYIPEDEALRHFDKLRKNLKLFTNEFDRVHVVYLNIVNYGIRSQKLDLLHTNLSIQIQTIKTTVKQFEEENKKEYITNIVETYILRILPLVQSISDQTYRLSTIEKDIEVISRPNQPDTTMEVMRLNQTPYTLNDLYILGSVKPKIITNIY